MFKLEGPKLRDSLADHFGSDNELQPAESVGEADREAGIKRPGIAEQHVASGNGDRLRARKLKSIFAVRRPALPDVGAENADLSGELVAHFVL